MTSGSPKRNTLLCLYDYIGAIDISQLSPNLAARSKYRFPLTNNLPISVQLQGVVAKANPHFYIDGMTVPSGSPLVQNPHYRSSGVMPFCYPRIGLGVC